MDPISESIHRSQQFRGPLQHEEDVRRMATELHTAYKQGALTGHDLRSLADCLETIVRKGTPLKAV